MKKEEIRKQFELKLNNIEPSETLIEDTIRRVKERDLSRRGLITMLRSCAGIILAIGIVTLAYVNNYKIDTEINMAADKQNNIKSENQSIEILENGKSKQKIESIESEKGSIQYFKVQGNKESRMFDGTISNTVKAVPENALNIQPTNDSTDGGTSSEELNNFALSTDANIGATEESKSMRRDASEDINVNVGDNEEKIIEIYENAKKEGDKYIVISEEREITFIVEEGKVTEIILR